MLSKQSMLDIKLGIVRVLQLSRKLSNSTLFLDDWSDRQIPTKTKAKGNYDTICV